MSTQQDVRQQTALDAENHGSEAMWTDLAALAELGPAPYEHELERAGAAADEEAPDSPAALYIREIGRTPLLTAEDEVRLAQVREAGKAAAAQLAVGVDDPAERPRLEALIRLGREAEARLIESNLRLVVSVARKYLGRGVSFLDLVQEGNIGLQRGVDKYDWRRGFRFSTYAYWWIRQAITRAVAEQGRTIRLPVHVFEQLTKLYTTSRALQVTLGREPTPEEIGQKLGLDPERVREAFRAARLPLSLDRTIGDDADTTVADLVADTQMVAPAEQVEADIFADELIAALGEHLTPRELQVLRLRFGLGGEQPRTLKEIGDELGISRERARQLEAESMRKLHKAASHLRQFLRFAS